MVLLKKRKASNHVNLRLWNRESGAFWLPFEREQIREYSKVRANENVSLTGYVKRLNHTTFALVPTLFSSQTYLICVNETNIHPIENSYIRISGNAQRHRIRKSPKQPAHSTLYESDLILYVDAWKNETPNFQIPKTTLNFKMFKRDLMSRIEGLSEFSQMLQGDY